MADRPALEIGPEALTYGALMKRAASLASTIQINAPASDSQTTAVLADRSVTAFAGILGSLLSGRAYVPLNPHFPAARTRCMLQQSGSRCLVVDEASAAQLGSILEG